MYLRDSGTFCDRVDSNDDANDKANIISTFLKIKNKTTI